MPEGAADRWGSKASKHFCCKDICLPQLARERPELLDVLRARLVAARDAKVEAADLRGAVPARRVARLQHERNATGHRAAARSEMQARVATMQAGGRKSSRASRAAAGLAPARSAAHAVSRSDTVRFPPRSRDLPRPVPSPLLGGHMFLHVLPQEPSVSELTLVTAPWSGVFRFPHQYATPRYTVR